MTGWLPDDAETLFGPGAVADEAYDLLTVDVSADAWVTALRTARSTLGCTFFDWLSAVDEPGTGFQVCAHVVALGTGAGADTGASPAGGGVRRLLVRTTVPYEAAVLPTATGVYPGAAWHERETHEMFGVDFTGHPHLAPLLLPEEFEGHPLRKDFVLAARVAKAWPGAKEPGESHDGGPKRRQMMPPGVPDPNDWGPLKGQLPPAPARPARAPRAAGAGDRPPRRTRSVSEGSASQAPSLAPDRATAPGAPGASEAPASPRGRTPDVPWERPAKPAPDAEAPSEPPTGPRTEPAAGPVAEPPADASTEPPTTGEPHSGGGDPT
ncbi:NADH-quinone oxidoreductase subunit C [Streptomyces sp.]|uniref:NADH-quinone oxidoreductase subunit C n=1 Tax=Streptomyces sp. TaxID=1931 RepID=UPI002F41243B